MFMRKLVVSLAVAMWLAGCTSASGPAFSAYSVTLPDGQAAFRVTCYGLLEGPGTCERKAEEICKGQPVRRIAAESRLGGLSGGKPDDRNISFQCGAAPVAAEPGAEKVPAPALPDRISLDADSNFDFDKAVLKPEARARLDQLIGLAQGRRIATVTVDGYTDSVGSDAYNVELSTRRARAVAAYLQEHGLLADRFVSHGFGKADPVDSNETATGRARNRRVEVRTDAQ